MQFWSFWVLKGLEGRPKWKQRVAVLENISIQTNICHYLIIKTSSLYFRCSLTTSSRCHGRFEPDGLVMYFTISQIDLNYSPPTLVWYIYNFKIWCRTMCQKYWQNGKQGGPWSNCLQWAVWSGMLLFPEPFPPTLPPPRLVFMVLKTYRRKMSAKIHCFFIFLMQT